jgi:hypothetical protein
MRGARGAAASTPSDRPFAPARRAFHRALAHQARWGLGAPGRAHGVNIGACARSHARSRSGPGQMQSRSVSPRIGPPFRPAGIRPFLAHAELTRFLAESLGDVITLHQGLQRTWTRPSSRSTRRRPQSRTATGLMGVRLRPRQPVRSFLPRGAPDREELTESQPELRAPAPRLDYRPREDHRALRAPAAQRHRARHRAARGSRARRQVRDRRDLDRRGAARQ